MLCATLAILLQCQSVPANAQQLDMWRDDLTQFSLAGAGWPSKRAGSFTDPEIMADRDLIAPLRSDWHPAGNDEIGTGLDLSFAISTHSLAFDALGPLRFDTDRPDTDRFPFANPDAALSLSAHANSFEGTLQFVLPAAKTAVQPGIIDGNGASTSRARHPDTMPVGELTDAPLGFRQLCARNPGECTLSARPAPAELLAPRTAMVLLNHINRLVNHRVSWQTDVGEDRWERPDSKDPRGDCEDFAIEKRDELVAAGFPAEDLYFAVGYLPHAGLHAVLVAHTDKGDMLLDSLSEWIVPWGKAPYIWVVRQVAANSSAWNTVPNLDQTGA